MLIFSPYSFKQNSFQAKIPSTDTKRKDKTQATVMLKYDAFLGIFSPITFEHLSLLILFKI